MDVVGSVYSLRDDQQVNVETRHLVSLDYERQYWRMGGKYISSESQSETCDWIK